MEFLSKLGINSTTGYFGLALLVIGGFLFLAGIGVISIQQVTVKKGRLTWLIGLVLTIVGLILVFPELSESEEVAGEQAVVTESSSSTPVSSSDPAPGSDANNSPANAEWQTIEFTAPDDGLWRKQGGSYTAIGSRETIAWSEESYEGDLELVLKISSTQDFTAANIIVYGDGRSQSTGNLIFTIASDLQAITADTIYEGGTYLFDVMKFVQFGELEHSILIRILDRKASLFIDDEEVGSAFLGDRIKNSGKIGLLKWDGIKDVTYSNLSSKGSKVIK